MVNSLLASLLMGLTAVSTASISSRSTLSPSPSPTPVWECNGQLMPVFCDSSKSPEQRVAALVSNLTLSEKISQIGSNSAPGIERLGIPAYQWWSEALHGVCISPSVHFRDPTPVATSFPEPILTSGSFNKDLFQRIGDVIGTEGRAMANAGNAGLTFWAPNINIVRDPRWGRLQETPGEDPFLTSQYAKHFVQGVQGIDPFWLQATSTCKHFASYNLDNWHGMDRYHFNALVTKQDWADTYSQPFEACVVGANASGIMCSYNAMNGVPTCADPNLLTTLARGKWKFDGYITADCGAAADVWTAHKYGGSAAGAVAASVKAGMDIDCGSFVAQNGMDAVTNCVNCTKGALKMSELDTAVAHLFRLRLRLGYFDPPSHAPYNAASYKSINYTDHFQSALQAAREGIVVLDNHKNALPLSTTAIKSIAVIGPNSDDGGTMQGVDCHGVPPYLITPKMAFANFSTVNHAMGCDINSNNKSGFAAAISATKNSDAVVLVMGIDQSIEYEMKDRTNLLLPGVQAELIANVKEAAGDKPVILVIMSGGVIDFTSQLKDGVDAAVWIGYPGQSGGQALAEIIFGDVAPSGRTVQTWYKNEDFADGEPTMIDMFNMNMRPNTSSNYPGRTYRFFTGSSLYPFGFGLSYTSWGYTNFVSHSTPSRQLTTAVINKMLKQDNRYDADVLVTLSVDVSNLGTVASDHSVLFFTHAPNAGSQGIPQKELVAFVRTGVVQPGQTTTVKVTLTAFALSVCGSEGDFAASAGNWTVSTDKARDDGGSAKLMLQVLNNQF